MIDDKYKIGNFINLLRKEKNMTQSELGKILGVTNKAVSKWEVGENTPDSSLFPLIAGVFGVSVDELYNGERNEQAIKTTFIKEKYYNSLKLFRRDSNLIMIVFVTYLLYLFIYFMTKPIKWSEEYKNDVIILFNFFIPVIIYLTSSAVYTILLIQYIIKMDFQKKKKIICINIFVLIFWVILIPCYIYRTINTYQNKCLYKSIIKKSQDIIDEN